MKTDEYLLSIVIPAYNAESTVARALDFIEKHKSDIKTEVIIINDGSTDNTKEVCEKYLKNNKKQNVVIRLVNQQNAGHGSAINYGIKNAKGKYLRVLDADDYLDGKVFEKNLEFLSECDSDLVCSDYSEINGRKRERFYWFNGKESFVDKKYDDVINRTSPYLLPCAAVKTDVIRNARVLIDEKCRYDDQEYDFLIIQVCQTVSYFADSVYNYVVGNINQSMSQENLKKNIRDHQKVVEWLVKHYYEIKLAEKKSKFVFDKIIIPLCHYQYYIAVQLKKSRKDFLSFDKFLKKYRKVYLHPGVAGKRLKAHRASKGLFI